MARWTDIAQWLGPTVNEGDGDGRPGEPEDRMTGHVGMVIHIAEGSYDGTIAWQRNPAAEVSSHFVVAKDGRIGQLVDTDDRSWCQSQGNSTWISVENEGHHWEALTPAQAEGNARIYAACMQAYHTPARLTDSPAVSGLGWHGMGGLDWGGHYDCPGEAVKSQRPTILARAVQILNGDDDVSAHTDAIIEAWRTGIDKAADGSPVEPVKWRVRDEAWQAHIGTTLDALKVGGVDLDALAAKVAALVPAPPTAAQIADELAARLKA